MQWLSVWQINLLSALMSKQVPENLLVLRAVSHDDDVLVGFNALARTSSLDSNSVISSVQKVSMSSGLRNCFKALDNAFWNTAWSQSKTWARDTSGLGSSLRPAPFKVFSRTRVSYSGCRRVVTRAAGAAKAGTLVAFIEFVELALDSTSPVFRTEWEFASFDTFSKSSSSSSEDENTRDLFLDEFLRKLSILGQNPSF